MSRRRATVMFAVLAAVPLFGLACKSSRAGSDRLAGAEKSRASLVAVGAHVIQVQMEAPGTFTNERSLPLAEDVKAYVGDKRIPVSQLKPGASLTVFRDAQTRKVIRIEAEQ